MIMKKYITIIATMLLLMTSCTLNKISEDELWGSYMVASGFNISSMTFDHDNDNFFEWYMPMSHTNIKGHYAIQGDEIHVMCANISDGILTFKIMEYKEKENGSVKLKDLKLLWLTDEENIELNLFGVKK